METIYSPVMYTVPGALVYSCSPTRSVVWVQSGADMLEGLLASVVLHMMVLRRRML